MLPPRVIAVLVPLLLAAVPIAGASSGGLGESVREAESLEVAAGLPELSDAVSTATPVAAVPGAAEPVIDLERVSWTVDAGQSLDDLAQRWGLRQRTLRALNPDLTASSRVEPGTRLVVYQADPETPPQSIGAPNRGRLRGGVPLPEGTGWILRDSRRRLFGTRSTIEGLLQAFNAYAERYPDGPPIALGDISARRGGRVFPHASHRTGRDVDIGYILTVPPPGKRHWKTANADNFDVERNWCLVRALVATGKVQQIFMSSRLQRLLMQEAAKELSPEEMARYFAVARHDPSERSIIRHWKGHRDHMHVRFACEPGNARCVSQSRS